MDFYVSRPWVASKGDASAHDAGVNKIPASSSSLCMHLCLVFSVSFIVFREVCFAAATVAVSSLWGRERISRGRRPSERLLQRLRRCLLLRNGNVGGFH